MTTPATRDVPHRDPGSRQAPPGGASRSGAIGRTGRAARNTGWNLVGIAVPFAAGFLTIPVLTAALGPARFGLVGLGWAVLEYLALLDAGLGRATVHLVAQRLRARDGVPGDVVAASVLAQAALGVVGGLALALAAGPLAGPVLDVPLELRAEAVAAFRVLAATVPFVLVGVALRGILEAAERFDVAAAVRVPTSTATFVVPAAMAAAGASVPAIFAALLVVRVLACVATLALVARCVPALRWARPAGWTRVRPLLAFGGWVAVSNVLAPVFLLLDRLVLGAIAGIVAVGFYTGPYEAVVRLLILPAAAASAIFPAMSALAGEADGGGRRALGAYYVGAVRALAVPMLGLAAAGIVLAPALLQAWLGAEYAANAGTAARLLLVGVVVNGVAHVPFAAIQALGRPDVTARLHAAEAALHVPLTILLVHRWGIAGAAGAWALRAAVDGVLVSRIAHRMLGVRWADVADGRAPRLLLVLAGVVGAALALHAGAGAPGPTAGALPLVAGLVVIGVAFAAVAWTALLTAADRSALRAALRRGA